MKKHFRTIVFIFISTLPLPLLTMNCARESRPTGGDKDTVEPKVIWEKPVNNSLNISPEKIVIKFSESITLDKIQENCQVSPPLDKMPQITANGNKVIIDLNDQVLQPNSTYNFTFSNAIKDLNEGNAIESYSYAFSNSLHIDSLRIAGKVRYAENLEIPKTAYVLLYDNMQDSAFKTVKPRYVTQVKKDGTFSLDHIAKGTYKIYALEDANKDFIWNQANEKIAFIDSVITPSAKTILDTIIHKAIDSTQKDSISIRNKTSWSHQNLQLYLFQNTSTIVDILYNKRISKYAYGWKWSSPILKEDVSISIPGFHPSTYSVEFLPKTDSVQIWFLDTSLIQKPEVKIFVKQKQAKDIDTLTFSSTKDLPLPLTCNTKNGISTIFKGDTIQWTLSRPIANETLDKIKVYIVKDSICLLQSYGAKYSYDSEKNVEIPIQIPPAQADFSPKYYYESQQIISHKTGLNRFALYFSKPFNPKDIIITLQEFPDIKDWYVAEYDKTTNSLLCWIVDSKVMKLKNPAISVKFGDNLHETKQINFNPDISKKDSYKTVKTGKFLAIVSDAQKNCLYVNNCIEVICNNPIQSFTDSLFSLIELKDSLQTSIITTIKVSPDSRRKLLIYYTGKPSKTYTLHVSKNAITDVYKNEVKDMQTLIKTQVPTSSKLYTEIHTSVKKATDNSSKYLLTAQWDEGMSYGISIPKGTFVDVYGALNDSCFISLQCPKKENYGTLMVVIPENHDNLVLQLLPKDAKKSDLVIQGIVKQGTCNFLNVSPGEYQLRAFVDVNANKIWDTGSYEKQNQPEKILIYEKPIVIKANWDNVIDWKIQK